MGTPVYAVAAGPRALRGLVPRLRQRRDPRSRRSDHFTVSAHLDEIDVALGRPGGRGRRAIGAVGETGSLAGPQLYFEIRRGGEALDPADWLAALGTAARSR